MRTILFKFLENSVASLATSLSEVGSEENQKNLLGEDSEPLQEQSVFNYLFSDQLKTYFGNEIGVLFRKVSPKDNRKTFVGRVVQAFSWAVSGETVFRGLQTTIEKLILEKYPNDPNAINWSAAKLVRTMNGEIAAYAKNPGSEGLKAVIESQLKKVIGVKDKN